MTIAYIGQGFLGIALLAATLQAMGVKKYLSPLHLSCGQAFFIFLAFALLMYAHVTDQFALLSVVMHSHTAKPLLYKVAGVWGNHEGSMLLWVLILTLYGACLTRQLFRQDITWHPVFPLLGLINFSFILFLIMACDPFASAHPVPLEGQDLNPLLQDPSLALHPPVLYLGTAGFVVPFVLASLALIQGKMPGNWATLLYPWVLFAWTALTLGLALGSYWAYYELGWGGWWFWDPVENAALMPWLTATALMHVLRVLHTTQTLRAWTLFLSILTFALCLSGTFLVRSGLLTSVHSFAVDPERGTMILIISCFLILPALALFIWRLPQMWSSATPGLLSRPGLILVMSFLLICGATTVAIGTFYPLVMEGFGLKITVGTPYYKATFIPMMLPLLLVLGAGPWVSWKKDIPLAACQQLLFLFLITLLCISAVYLVFGISRFLGLAALTGALWIILTTLVYAVKNKKYLSGMIYAHLGIGIAILGIVGSSLGEQEVIKMVKRGESFTVGPYSLTLQNVTPFQGPNYQAQQAVFILNPGGALLKPEKRFYWTQDIIHGESAIRSAGLHHLYITLGDEYEGQRWSIHAYYKPFINLLGMGGILIVLGGIIAFLKRIRPKKISYLGQNPVLCFRLKKNQMAGFIALTLFPISALEAPEQLSDPLLEKRARNLGSQILCPQCQGQLLDESPVTAARHLRYKIRQLLVQGQTDQQIIEKLIREYGPQVIINPTLNKTTCILWFAPWIIFIAGSGIVIGKILRHSSKQGKKR